MKKSTWIIIKKKTELRELIKQSIGNTGSLDFVEFYEDGVWEVMSCSTHSHNCVRRINIAVLGANSNYCDGYVGSIDFGITHNLNQIEYVINEV